MTRDFERDRKRRCRRILLPRHVAEAAIDTLIGMPLSCTPEWDEHSKINRCGIITGAQIANDRLMVDGLVWPMFYPQFLQPPAELGMSYEMTRAHVRDMQADIWTLTKTTFIGAAVLLRRKAACKTSSFHLLTTAPEMALAA